ncbi:MAG TPA: SAM-dependent methyltransferase [Magnetospirillaceae bacterium]|jgi:methyltransferase (TIGR00027 family)
MQTGQFSRTALGAAGHRAVHQVLEQGVIFADPLAVPILGDDFAEQLDDARAMPAKRGLRLFVALRARFAEDALARAVEAGTGQLVVLGAGLDTYAYRGACRDRLRIFEVDYPATQEWKRARLAAASIPLPPQLTFAPVDFERETLAEGLAAAGFDATRPSFFIWLGVVPYLTEAAVFATLGYVAALPGGAEIVFDCPQPEHMVADLGARAFRAELARRVGALGEPLLSRFAPEDMRARLAAAGFGMVEMLGPEDSSAMILPVLGAPWHGVPHLVRASTR